MQHLHEQCVLRDVPADVLEIEIVLGTKTEETYFWKSDEKLTELILYCWIKVIAVVEQCHIDLLLVILHLTTIDKTNNIC